MQGQFDYRRNIFLTCSSIEGVRSITTGGVFFDLVPGILKQHRLSSTLRTPETILDEIVFKIVIAALLCCYRSFSELMCL